MKLDLDQLRKTPAYPYAEAAHYLNVPVSTLRSWCLGQTYPHKGSRRRFRPLITPDGGPGEGLSFLNLVEAHVLAATRRTHGISLPKVRTALDYVGRKLRIDRPLAHTAFQTNGIDLFTEELGRILNVTQDGQVEMDTMLRAYLERIERDVRGFPIKLFPFTRKAATRNAPAPVEIDPRIAFGRPVLRGRAVPTAVLADRFKAGDTLRELAGDYDTSTEEIEEAIRCELDRRVAS